MLAPLQPVRGAAHQRSSLPRLGGGVRLLALLKPMDRVAQLVDQLLLGMTDGLEAISLLLAISQALIKLAPPVSFFGSEASSSFTRRSNSFRFLISRITAG